MSQFFSVVDSMTKSIPSSAMRNQGIETILKRRILLALFATLLALLASVAQPQFAFAETTHECSPTEEQLQEYRAAGDLEERQRYQEALDNASADSWLIQEALLREGETNAASVPTDWKSGMPTVGNAYIVLLCIDFPDKKFTATDTATLLEQLAFGGAPSVSFPYESLNAYYERSSYGKLHIGSPLGSGQRVLNYTAKFKRDHYTNNVEELFEEALGALSTENSGAVDFSQFDANDDGIIDAIYLHYAGGDTGWGSTWWSNERIYKGSMQFNGKKPGNLVLLSSVGSSSAEYSGIQDALQTMIHETGHVLGLPDYYSGNAMQTTTSERTGILTFDMMMQNTGDHNGFSKWMLGWMDGATEGDNEKVTRVVANDAGITVQHGNETPEVFPSEPKSFDLESFTSLDRLEDSGGIIVVSNQNEGIFSEYFFLQYDTFAQNQTVTLNDGTKLPSGFRLYHVNATLNDTGSDFVHTNFMGSLYDQLIELVDPDMAKEHGGGNVPQAINEDFHCMLFEGDEVAPSTFPSSNYSENITSGYTGLSIVINSSGGLGQSPNGQGSFTLSYSSADRPSPDTFTLTPVSGLLGANNAGTFVLSASYTPLMNASPEYGPYLLVDGVRAPTYATLGKGQAELSIRYMMFDSLMQKDSVCELVFPEGCFITSIGSAGPTVSSEMRFPVAPGAVTAIEKHGNFAEYTGTNLNANSISGLVAMDEGSIGFFQKKLDGIYLYKIDVETCSIIPLAGSQQGGSCVVSFADHPEAAFATALQAVSMGQGNLGLCLTIANPISGSTDSAIYSIDSQGSIAGSCVVDDFTPQAVLSSENALLLYRNDYGATIAQLCDFSDGLSQPAVSPKLSTVYENLFSLESGTIAASRRSIPDFTTVMLDLFDKQTVMDAARAAALSPDPSVDFLAAAAPLRTVQIDSCQYLYSVSQSGSDILVAKLEASSLDPQARTATLVRINEQGLTTSTSCAADAPLQYSSLQSTDGFTASIFRCPNMTQAFSYAETSFLNDQSHQLSLFDFPYGSSGLWVGQSYFVIGAIEECGVYFWKTAAFGQGPLPPGPVPTGPVPSDGPSGPQGKPGLAGTGDAAPDTDILCLPLALSSLLISVCVARRLHLKTESDS